MEQFAIALSGETSIARFGETKSGKFKTGSLARAIVFMNKQERMTAGQQLYAKWLATGQFRPIVEDILSCGLIAKSAVPIVKAMAGLQDAGQVPKDVFIRLCNAVDLSVRADAAKKAVDKGGLSEQYLPKATSDKGFVLALCSEVARGVKPADVLNAE